VARQIRYSGISMGKGEGYTLHPGKMDFNDRAGVCKDIAGMLITMFRAAGYTNTFPAMTMAGARVEDIPADQFNHCVVATEVAPNVYKMYDPTWCPFSREVWSSAEKPQNYVIGTPRGEQLMETPPAPPSDNLVKLASTAAVDEAGDLTGTLVITGGHYSETNLVWAVINSPAFAVRSTFEQWLSKLSPRAELVSYETADPVDVTKPFSITLKYRVPGYAMVSGGRMALVPPMARNLLESRRLTDFIGAIKGDSRDYGIYLRASRQFVYEETVSVPKGYAMVSSPEVKPLDGPSAGWTASYAFRDGRLAFGETLTIKKKIIPAGEYGSLRDAVKAWQGLSDAPVLLDRKG
jgi:hypothetical protein